MSSASEVRALSAPRGPRPCALLAVFLLLVAGVMACAPELGPEPLSGPSSSEGSEHEGEQAGSVAADALPSAQRASSSQLRGCEEERFEIDLLDAVAQMPDGTLESQREQLRDWIWVATLGRVSLASSVSNVFPGLVDVPLVRDDALADALHLPVGPTRSAVTKGGEVLVLVEVREEAAMTAAIAEAVDEQAVALGQLPARVAVFGFELVPSLAKASVCRLRTLDRETLQSSEQGYRAATLTTARQLEEFLDGGIDLLSARCTASGLQVSGRQRARAAGAPISVEHVAALAQRLGVAYRPTAQFGRSLDELPEDERSSLQEMAQSMDQVASRATAEELRTGVALGIVPAEAAKTINTIRAWKRSNPAVPTEELIYSYQLQSAYDGNPGFSLDPEYTPERAVQAVDAVLATMDTASALGRLLQSWGEQFITSTLADSTPPPEVLAAAAAELSTVRARLATAPAERVPVVLSSASLDGPDGGLAAQILQAVRSHAGRQCARYDGPFAGTQAGMTFFYTDAGAKFFARDWNDASPEGEIPGFESVVNHVGSSAWCSEGGRSATRIWFGLRNEAYAKSRKGELRFAPTATRLFAKGSSLGGVEEESEPNASYRRFISWWDNHYAAMAAWDPQYETLNQLLKWSAVVQSVRLDPKPACNFLDEVPIGREARLSTWVRQNPELRWSAAFREVQGPDTASTRECLPIIESKLFESCGLRQLSGGVSAATLAEVRSKAVSSVTVPRALGRLGREGKGMAVKGDGVRIERIIRNNGAELKKIDVKVSPSKVTFSAEIGTDVSQTGSRWMSDPRAPVRKLEKTIARTGTELELREKLNALRGTGLEIIDLDRAQLRIKLDPGSEVAARSFGEQVVRQMNRDGASLDEALARLAPEADIWALEEGRVAVRGAAPQRGEGLLIMDSGGGNRGPPPGASSGVRLGSPEGGASGGGWHGGGGDSIVVWIVPERGAKPYLAKRAPAVPDSTLTSVEALLAADQRAAALAALDRAPSVGAAKLLLDDSLQRTDWVSAKHIIQSVAKSRDAKTWHPLYDVVERHRVLLRRRGGDPSELATLSMQLAMIERRALMPELTEAAEVAAHSARVVMPSDFAIQGALPPPIHPRNAPLRPDQQYVSRVVAMPVELDASRPLTTLAGERYRVRAGGAPKDWDWTSVGPAIRALETTRPAVMVVACSDERTDGAPPCHEPPTVAEQFHAMLQEAAREVLCDSDGDLELSLITEQLCSRRIDACDVNDDGFWNAEPERVCVEQVRAGLSATNP